MKTRKCILGLLLLSIAVPVVRAEENIRRIATWNMKWLGVNSGNQLDPVENVPQYADYIKKTGATFFALQEIGATHSVEGQPRCHYLDLIVGKLNEDSDQWVYVLDEQNGRQRLAFLYNESLWSVTDAHTVWPGSSFRSARRPFVATVEAVGDNADLVFTHINIHLKAFPDAESRGKRAKNVEELAAWIEEATLDGDLLIAGDTNIYVGETDTDDPFEDVNCVALTDREKTSIHEDKLSQRFDRFFCSDDLKKEIDSAKSVVGSAGYIDVIKDNQPAKIKWFDKNISDHFAVVLHIDVSRDRKSLYGGQILDDTVEDTSLRPGGQRELPTLQTQSERTYHEEKVCILWLRKPGTRQDSINGPSVFSPEEFTIPESEERKYRD